MHEFNQAGNVSRAGWWRKVLWELQLFVSLKSLWTRTTSSSHPYIAIFPPPFSIPTPPLLPHLPFPSVVAREQQLKQPPPIVTHLLVPLTMQAWPKTVIQTTPPFLGTLLYVPLWLGATPFVLCGPRGRWSMWQIGPQHSWWVIHYSRLQLSFKDP